ncbi:la-related protein 6A-like [Magnolia sinica]|uniref:la-related protein 6A-like n=1 Tax=Magnolia sinica TaxID=86752 RepID=UPI0026586ECC|nr:la-related protein 6A-like [Magnolia sinica]
MDGGEDEEGISHHPLSPFPFPPPAEEIESESQESLGFQDSATAAEALSDTISASSSKPDPLSDGLRDKIVRQVEYYFSDENLPTDKFLMKFVKKDKEGFVPMAVIASFRKMKKLVQDISLVEAALRTSSQLVVSSDGKKVKRLNALPDIDIEDAKLRTVLVENLPDDYSTESIQRIFGDIGNIKNICIRNPHSTEESTKASKAEKVISSKLHALIEYETIEAAEKAVATLNNEKNWRSGMQVELLLKRMQKYGFAPKGRKGTLPEKSNHSTAADTAGDEKNKSSVHHDETHEEEHEEEHLQSEKGGRRGRNRGRGRNHSHRHYNINGHGHGSVSGPGSEGLTKPPPGPRMPDGTRGFTMGRGKPPTSNHQ